jgi:hypothetical protein
MSELYISRGINDASYVLLDKIFKLDHSHIHELNDESLNILDISSNKAFDTKITNFFAKTNIKNKIIASLICNDASLCCYSVSDISLNLTFSDIGAGFTDLYYASIANQSDFFYKITIVYHFSIARPLANGGGLTKFSMKLTIFKPDTCG